MAENSGPTPIFEVETRVNVSTDREVVNEFSAATDVEVVETDPHTEVVVTQRAVNGTQGDAIAAVQTLIRGQLLVGGFDRFSLEHLNIEPISPPDADTEEVA